MAVAFARCCEGCLLAASLLARVFGQAVRLRGFDAAALRCLGLDLSDGGFEREALAGNIGFAERWRDASQLRDQCGARTLIERTPLFAGCIAVQPGNGARDERIIICHYCPVCTLRVTIQVTAAEICSRRVRLALSLERIVHQNGILALRAGREQRHRAPDQFLDAADIFDRLRRQVGPGPRAGGRSFQPSMVS